MKLLDSLTITVILCMYVYPLIIIYMNSNVINITLFITIADPKAATWTLSIELSDK